MALILVAFLPRALVGFGSYNSLSLTAPFGDSIAVPLNTGIKEYSKKAFKNKPNTKK